MTAGRVARSAPADPRRFLKVVLGAAALGAMLGVRALAAPGAKGWLPAPPLTATNCVDSKFALLRRLDLSDRTLVAVGSSATWRNLDLELLERRFPGTRAYNVAPCYLHMDQTAFFAEFMLDRMPQVET